MPILLFPCTFNWKSNQHKFEILWHSINLKPARFLFSPHHSRHTHDRNLCNVIRLLPSVAQFNINVSTLHSILFPFLFSYHISLLSIFIQVAYIKCKKRRIQWLKNVVSVTQHSTKTCYRSPSACWSVAVFILPSKDNAPLSANVIYFLRCFVCRLLIIVVAVTDIIVVAWPTQYIRWCGLPFFFKVNSACEHACLSAV